MDRMDPRICTIDGGADCPREGAILRMNIGQPIVTSGEFCLLLCKNL